jgi:predicted AlkP superfamily phosphohydrolase/phosphomutase
LGGTLKERYKKMHARKVLIIGLDCMTPQLAFDQYIGSLPNLKALMGAGYWGNLRSCEPPITVPAWSCMMTSKDPGQLGFYGFRNRKDYTYDALYFANSLAVREPTVWNILSRNRKDSVLIGIPQTYPTKPLRGHLVTGFLAPDNQSAYTYPDELKQEVERVADGYIIDVKDFRTENKEWLKEQVYRMTEKRFRVVEHFLKTKPWDFFMFVEMGPDRLHHGFWRYCDTGHRLYEPGNPYRNVLLDYYIDLDRKIGGLLERIDLRNTSVFVVSDHGAKAMQGGICVNEWLAREGYLRFKEPPKGATRLRMEAIDWAGTRVWGEGGYYCRLFFNVQGREPQGVIPPEEYEKMRSEIVERLEALGDEEGRPIGTRVHRPEDLYRETRNVAPDLIAYFGDLDWRSVGSVGTGCLHTFENDTGPDDANHDYNGIFLFADPRIPASARGRELKGISLYDIAPSVLDCLGLQVPPDMLGRKILDRARLQDV